MAITHDTGTWALTRTGWPWPRMFITDYYVLVITYEGTDLYLYELVLNDNTWSAQEIVYLAPVALVDSVSVAWFEKYYILALFSYDSEGVLLTRMMERKPLGDYTYETVVVDVSDGLVPHGTALCNFRNQLFVGGLKSADIKWQSLGTCAVAYSGIGNREFDPLVDPTAGWVKMPWDIENQGKIFAIEPLGNTVIVYGNRGIEKLTPFSHPDVNGYGQETIGEFGALDFNCVCASKRRHCFIDSNYDLCLLDGDGIKILGYRPFMETLDHAKIIISYEPSKQHFYISDNYLCFVLTPHGLYSTHQLVNSIGKFIDIICGFVLETSDNTLTFCTAETNFGSSALKSLENVELSINYSSEGDYSCYGDVDVRNTYKGDMLSLPTVEINENGGFTKKATGRSFKIGWHTTYIEDADFDFSKMEARIKYVDRKGNRGKLNVR